MKKFECVSEEDNDSSNTISSGFESQTTQIDTNELKIEGCLSINKSHEKYFTKMLDNGTFLISSLKRMLKREAKGKMKELEDDQIYYTLSIGSSPSKADGSQELINLTSKEEGERLTK